MCCGFTLFLDQVFCSVDWSLRSFTTHMAIDAGAPIAPIAGAAAVVNVEHCVALVGQGVVEHIFPEVAAPPFVRILQVAGSMHKDHGRFGRMRISGPIETGVHRRRRPLP